MLRLSIIHTKNQLQKSVKLQVIFMIQEARRGYSCAFRQRMTDLTLTGARLTWDRGRWSGFWGEIRHNALQLVSAVLWTYGEEVRGVNKTADNKKSEIYCCRWSLILVVWLYEGGSRQMYGEIWSKQCPIDRYYQQEVQNKWKENNEWSKHDDKEHQKQCEGHKL